MATYQNNFNNGSQGVDITTANSGDSGTPFNEIRKTGSPTIAYTTSGSHDGSVCGYVYAPEGTQGAVRWNFGSAQSAVAFRGRYRIVPDGHTLVFCNFFNSNYGVAISLAVEPAGTFVVLDDDNTVIGRSTVTVDNTKWYRVEVTWDQATTTLWSGIYENDDTTAVFEASSSSAVVQDVFYGRWGVESTQGVTTVLMDDLEVVTGSSDRLGPYASAAQDTFNAWENDTRVPVTIRGEYVGGAITNLIVRGVTGQDLPSSAGSPFVVDETEATALNSGLMATGISHEDLEVHDGDLTLEPGVTYEGLLVRGQVFAQPGVNGWTIRDSSIVSRVLPGYVGGGVVNLNGTGLIQRTEITQWDPLRGQDNSNWWASAIMNKAGSTVFDRCDLHDVLDGIYVTGGIPEVYGCYGHDWQFRDDDQDQSGSSPPYWTHNDWAQVMAGGIKFHGNTLDMRFSELTGMPRTANPDPNGVLQWRNCHGILLQGQYGQITQVQIYKNWARYGSVFIRAAGGNYTGNQAEIWGNRITPNQGMEFSQYTQMSNEPNTHWTWDVHDNVYSDDADTPVEWRGQPLKAPVTTGSKTAWQFDKYNRTGA